MEQPNQEQAVSIAKLLEDYDAKIKSGDITWENKDGVAVISVKTYHPLTGAANEQPIQMPFSEIQLIRLRQDQFNRASELRIQGLSAIAEANRIEKDFEASYGKIEKDVEKTLKAKDGKK